MGHARAQHAKCAKEQAAEVGQALEARQSALVPGKEGYIWCTGHAWDQTITKSAKEAGITINKSGVGPCPQSCAGLSRVGPQRPAAHAGLSHKPAAQLQAQKHPHAPTPSLPRATLTVASNCSRAFQAHHHCPLPNKRPLQGSKLAACPQLLGDTHP